MFLSHIDVSLPLPLAPFLSKIRKKEIKKRKKERRKKERKKKRKEERKEGRKEERERERERETDRQTDKTLSSGEDLKTYILATILILTYIQAKPVLESICTA